MPDRPDPRAPARRAGSGLAWLVALAMLSTGCDIGSTSPDPNGTPDATSSQAPVARATLAPTVASPAPSFPSAPSGPTVKARVVRVIDGDTIVVDIGGKQSHLRYIGMDTPESVKPNTPVEPYALAATAANKALVSGKNVRLEKDVSETDQYGRLLRNVWVEHDGRLIMVGLELVRMGFAQVTTFPPDVKYVDALVAAERTAQAAGLGLWAATAAPS